MSKAAIVGFRFAAAAAVRVRAVTAGREKLLYREVKPFKHIARIFRTTTVSIISRTAAILRRHTDIICRHEQLNIPFQTNNRELAKCDIQLFDVIAQNDIIPEQAADIFRHLVQFTAAAAAAARLYNLCRKNQRVKSFYLCPEPDRSPTVSAASFPAVPRQTAHVKQSPNPAAHAYTIHFAAMILPCRPDNPQPYCDD